ncbi:MAG TPA: GNAT family N-acetyltransferase [Ginsengibacter sp.]|nr:GNAT family N-acetyltransferase [Ginsengibacter sp.]
MKSIKAVGLNDLYLIHDLAHAIWPDAYGDILSKEQLRYMLEKIYSLASLQNQFISLQHNFILVYDNDIPVGFASFSRKEKDSPAFHLHKIYVLPQQQGNGIGKMLLEYVINSVKEKDAMSLNLNVNRYNKALHFYKKQGFEIIREENIDIGQGYFMNDYIMELRL